MSCVLFYKNSGLRILEEPRRDPDAIPPSVWPDVAQNLSCFSGGGHSCHLKGASSKKAGEHSEVTLSTVMQGTLEKKKINAKNTALHAHGGEFSWKVINVRVGEHKSLLCFVLRLPLTRTPRK